MPQPAKNDTKRLIAHLADRDVPCPLCGYNLRGLQRAACPECNRALVLKVDLVEHIIRAFVLALVGLGTAVGIGGMCVLAATLDVLFRNDFEPLLDGVTASGFVIALAGMLILVKHRRRFMRIRPARRLGVSVLCWIPTLSIVGFLLWWR